VPRFTLQIPSPVALAVWLTTVPLAGLAAPAPANRLIDEQRARDRELTQDRYPPGVPESPAAPALDALPAALEEPGAVMRDARLDVDAAGLIAPHRLADLLSLDFVPDNSDGWTAFHNDGELIAGGTFRLGNRQEGSNRGVIRAGGDIVAVQAVVDVPASAEGLPGAGAEGLPGSPAAMLANSGIIDAGRDLYMELVENDGGMLRAGRDAFIWQTWRIETNPFLPSPPGAQGLIDALRDVFMFQAGGNAVPDGAEPATGSEAPAPPAGASVSFGALMMNVLPETPRSTRPFLYSPSEELAALRNALIATTGRALIIPGLAWDPETGQPPELQQQALLAANGAAFAIAHGLPVGSAISAAQSASTTQDSSSVMAN
jgi:hypothetical protein